MPRLPVQIFVEIDSADITEFFGKLLPKLAPEPVAERQVERVLNPAPDPPEPTPPTVNGEAVLTEIRQTAKTLVKTETGKAQLKRILSDNGASKISELSADVYPEVLKELQNAASS